MSEPRRDLRNYFTAVDRKYSMIRGVPAACSPRDVQQIIDWFYRGIPLALLLRTLDEASKQHAGGSTARRPIRSLAFVKRAVDRSYKRHQLLLPGGAEEEKQPVTRDLIARILGELQESLLLSLPGKAGDTLIPDIGSQVAKMAAELPERLSMAAVEKLEKKLAAWNERLQEHLARAYPERSGEAVREAERSVGRCRDFLSSAGCRALAMRRAGGILLRRLDVPSLSLFQQGGED